ncbi:MAG TPA: hypothetical protein PKW82_09290, partial [Spirochaetales bacterium]|nr:hypothetical protein [Spirochaetales bacterium]
MRFVPARGGLPRRRLAAVAALILSGALAALSGPPLAGAATRASASFAAATIHALGAPLGLEISYESASPSVLGTVTVRELAVRRPSGETLLSAEKASIGYDARAFLEGDAGAALRRLELSGVHLELELGRDGPLIERLAESASGDRTPGEGATRLEVSLRRFSASVEDGRGGSWQLDGRSAELALESGRIDAAVSGTLGGRSPVLGALSGSTLAFSVSGRGDAAFTTGRWEAELAVETPVGDLRSQRFSLLLRGGSVEARRLRDDVPIDLTVRVAPDLSIQASARFERFAPRRSFTPRALPPGLVPWLSGTYNGDASIEFGANLSEPRFSLRVSGGAPPSVAGPGVRFSVDASGSPESVAIRSLDVSSSDFDVAVSGSVLPRTLGLDLEAKLALGSAGRLPVLATLRALGASGAYFALADGISVAGVGFGALVAKADVVDGVALFKASVELPLLPPAGSTGASVDVTADGTAGETDAGDGSADSRLELEGALTLGEEPYLEARASLGRLEAGAFAPLLEALLGAGARLLPADLALSFSLSLASDFRRLSWSTGDLVAVAPSLDFAARLAAAGGLEHVEIRSSAISIAGYQASGSGHYAFPAKGNPSFAVDFTLDEIPYAFEGALADGGLDLRGDYGLSLSIRDGPFGAEASVAVESMPLPLPFGT